MCAQRRLTLILVVHLVLTLAVVGCGKFFRTDTSSGGSGSSATEFLYVANANNGGQGSVSTFTINTTSGALTANGTLNAQNDTSVLAIDPQNRFLFAGNNAGGISA